MKSTPIRKSLRERLDYITAEELSDDDVISWVCDISEKVTKNITIGELKKFLKKDVDIR